MHERLIGAAAVGFGIIILLIPVFLVFGVSQHTALLLFYASPLSAVIAVYILEKGLFKSTLTQGISPVSLNPPQASVPSPRDSEMHISLQNGRSYTGVLNKISDDVFALKLGNDAGGATIFLQKDEIKSIKKS